MTPRRDVVLLLSDEYPPHTACGGVARLSEDLAKLLRRAGHDVEIVAESPDADEFTHFDADGNLVHRVSGERSYLVRALRRLGGRVASRLPLGDVAFATRCAEKVYELTHLWNRRILWIECASWRAPSSLLQLVPGLAARTVVRNVTPLAEVARANETGSRRRLALGLELLQQLLARHRFYASAEYRRHFEALVRPEGVPGWTRAEERIFLLPFDLARVARRRPQARREGPLRLLMIGRLEPRKGFEEVCAAIASLDVGQRARLRIVAAGRDTSYGALESYEKLLRARFPEVTEACFDFRGPVAEAELARLIEGADAGLVASRSESFGYNLVELLAAGLPVITSDVGAASELERRGVRYLGKYRDAAGLQAILGDLPARLAAEAATPADNRAALEALYRENDRAYLGYVKTRVSLPALARPRQPPSAPAERVDIVIPTYGRFDEPLVALASALEEAARARSEGVDCRVTVVHQDADLPERLFAVRPGWRHAAGLQFVPSSPPSLPHARNVGLRHTSGDLVIFIDDDVTLAPGFVLAHLRAANAKRAAIGVAGGVRSRFDLQGIERRREVGQVRASGFIACHYDSLADQVACTTPTGANMAFKRAAMDRLFGPAWFDERFEGSAFREESTLALEVFRRGGAFAFAPDALLDHHAAETGGCENRFLRSLSRRTAQRGLEYLFLNELYRDAGEGVRLLAPLLTFRRDLGAWEGTRVFAAKALIGAGGYLRGGRLFAQGPRRPDSARDGATGPREMRRFARNDGSMSAPVVTPSEAGGPPWRAGLLSPRRPRGSPRSDRL